jgi:small nuclear ribonucleoprotein (snRNP)-like protein
MKKIISILTLLLTLTSFSQLRIIEITEIRTGKTMYYEDNQNVKIRTLDGKKHKGILKLVDNETFLVGDETIKIESLHSIKINPKGINQIKNIVLYTGVAIVATGLILATVGNNAAFLVLTVGSSVTIGAGIIEGINGYNSLNKWNFKIVEKQP